MLFRSAGASQKTPNHHQRATLLVLLLPLSLFFLSSPVSSSNLQIFCVCFVCPCILFIHTFTHFHKTQTKIPQTWHREQTSVSQRRQKQMPTLKRNKKASGSSSNTSETHKFLAQVQQQQQPSQDHNLKHKAADSEKVAEEDSENKVVESPEVKRQEWNI